MNQKSPANNILNLVGLKAADHMPPDLRVPALLNLQVLDPVLTEIGQPLAAGHVDLLQANRFADGNQVDSAGVRTRFKRCSSNLFSDCFDVSCQGGHIQGHFSSSRSLSNDHSLRNQIRRGYNSISGLDTLNHRLSLMYFQHLKRT